MPSLSKVARGSRVETCEMPSAAATAGTGHELHMRSWTRMALPSRRGGKLDRASALAPRVWRDARPWQGVTPPGVRVGSGLGRGAIRGAGGGPGPPERPPTHPPPRATRASGGTRSGLHPRGPRRPGRTLPLRAAPMATPESPARRAAASRQPGTPQPGVGLPQAWGQLNENIFKQLEHSASACSSPRLGVTAFDH